MVPAAVRTAARVLALLQTVLVVLVVLVVAVVLQGAMLLQVVLALAPSARPTAIFGFDFGYIVVARRASRVLILILILTLILDLTLHLRQQHPLLVPDISSGYGASSDSRRRRPRAVMKLPPAAVHAPLVRVETL